MNLTALIAGTYQRMGIATTDGLLTSTVVTQFVNDANNMIASSHDWPWQQVMPVTFTTTANVQDYAPPADWLRTVDLRVSAPQVGPDGLTLYSVMELDDRWSAAQPGQPTEYAIFGDHIRLAPTPDQAYTISHRYIRLEPDLSSGSDTPIMPAQFHAAICEYAAFLGLRRIQEEARANVALAAYQQWLSVMLQDRRRSTAPQRIRVRPGSLV